MRLAHPLVVLPVGLIQAPNPLQRSELANLSDQVRGACLSLIYVGLLSFERRNWTSLQLIDVDARDNQSHPKKIRPKT